ncbi:DUF4139 domain-containing protein [Hydrogenimonas urashimensis]|uniref:DUF4139 domain-containing protein n=1 Tax=Hydrogenimonas urashimensis TaxID=2740515 RepID=UPI001915A918|nr:DUF4139 domain-containing protein [Hydrogenimonas urashimensis]
MKYLATVLMAAGIGLALEASTFELYRDGAIYTYRPQGSFVGFAPKGSVAECGGSSFSLVPSNECPKKSRLCKEKAAIDRLALDAAFAGRQMSYIDMLMKRAEIKSADAKAIVSMAEGAARRYSAMQKRKELAEKEGKWRKEAFMKQAPSFEPLHLPKPCGGEVKVTLPGGYISFDMLYEAEITGEKSIGVHQKIGLRNRSGIDIEADKALLYYQPLNRTLRPLRFSPWVIRDRHVSRERVLQKRAMPAVGANMMMADVAYESVEKRAPRSYRIDNLTLPSTGESVEIDIASWQTEAERFETVYPYRDLRAYNVLRFKPKGVIEANRWRIRKGNKLVASNLYGEYRGGLYTLFVSVDEDLIVRREKMILKEKESFFGGSLHKKDGYVIHLLNQSRKKKHLKIVERIPVAVRSDIKVKLLQVKSDKPIRYRVAEKGRLDIEMTLPPESKADLRVLFEVSYDKEKPIIY